MGHEGRAQSHRFARDSVPGTRIEDPSLKLHEERSDIIIIIIEPGTTVHPTSIRDRVFAHREHITVSLQTLVAALISALIWMVPFTDQPQLRVQLNLHSPHISSRLIQGAHLGPVDVILVMLIVVSLPMIIRRRWGTKLGMGSVGALGLAVTATVRLLFDPTVEGTLLVLRLIGIVVVILAVSDMKKSVIAISVLWPIALTALYQGALALTETLVWNSGYRMTYGQGGWTAGYGTFNHPYVLAAFLVLAVAVTLSAGAWQRIPVLMWASIATASAAVATTFGRTGVLSLLLIGATFGIGAATSRRPRLATYALSVVVPFSIAATILRSPWTVRAIQTANLSATGRQALMARALDVIAFRPFFGVGPAQYAPALADIGLTDVDWLIVHNVPLLVAAELGVLAGILFVVWLTTLGILALRTTVHAVAVFVVLPPYLMLDNLNWTLASGVVIMGLWIAMLDYHMTDNAHSKKANAVSTGQPRGSESRRIENPPPAVSP